MNDQGMNGGAVQVGFRDHEGTKARRTHGARSGRGRSPAPYEGRDAPWLPGVRHELEQMGRSPAPYRAGSAGSSRVPLALSHGVTWNVARVIAGRAGLMSFRACSQVYMRW